MIILHQKGKYSGQKKRKTMIKLGVYYMGGQNYPAVQLDGFFLICELPHKL